MLQDNMVSEFAEQIEFACERGAGEIEKQRYCSSWIPWLFHLIPYPGCSLDSKGHCRRMRSIHVGEIRPFVSYSIAHRIPL